MSFHTTTYNAADLSVLSPPPVDSIYKCQLRELLAVGRQVVLFTVDDTTFVLDLEGFIHPGPLLTDGEVKFGENITALFRQMSKYHQDKDPLAKIKVVGRYIDVKKTPDSIEQIRAELAQEYVGDGVHDDDEFLLDLVIEELDRRTRSRREVIRATIEDLRPAMAEMRQKRRKAEAADEESDDPDLCDYMVRHQLPYWDYGKLERMWKHACGRGDRGDDESATTAAEATNNSNKTTEAA